MPTLHTAPVLAPTSPSPPLALSWGARAALWRALTQQGKRAFEQRHDTRARQLYEEALSEAEALFAAARERGSDEPCRLAPTAYNLSCHNIAELARRQNDAQTEGIFLYRAYDLLVSAAESATAPPSLRSSCVQQLSGASAALVGYLAEQGMQQAAIAYSERAKLATLQVLRACDGAAS